MNKASQGTDIPTKILRKRLGFFPKFFFSNFNDSINKSIFSSIFKMANITIVYKKDTKSVKNNYRTVTVLSNISKLYNRFMFIQMLEYFESFFSKHQCGFRKDFSAQHFPVSVLEK